MWESVVTFRSRKEGTRKKFGETLVYVFKKFLGSVFHFLPLCYSLQVLYFNFLHNPYVRHIIIGQSKEYIHPCIGITNFL